MKTTELINGMGREVKTTRRDFLKQSAGAAGAVILGGMTSSCISSKPMTASMEKEIISAAGGRHHFSLFSQGNIGEMTMKNRIVRSATMISAASGGEATDIYIDMHRVLSKGGTGLIITGFMIPTEKDATNPRQMYIFDDRHIPSLAKVANAVHEADGECRIFAQIGHSGYGLSPSGILQPFSWKRGGRAMKTSEIEAVVTDFAKAVLRVKQSGFDGVELHGAHAYLLSTFLSPRTNRRDDKYGGSVEKRARIIKDIMIQSRDLVGLDFPIIIKLNSDDNVVGGIKPESFHQVAEAIAKTGVDAIDVSGNDCLQEDIDNPEEETYFLEGARGTDVKPPIIVTGGNRSVDHLETILNEGKVSFFGIARPLIREPALPNRWLEGRGEIEADCISCNQCFGVVMRGETTYCVQEAL